MTVLITGATGTVGSHVVRTLSDRGVPLRAFVRDRDKAAAMLGEHVELAIGDFADPGSLIRALRGVDRVVLACANVPGQIEYENSVIDAARASGIARVVKVSGPSASVDSPLVFERWHAEIEAHLRASGLRSVVLRPSAYMTNLLAYAATIAQTGTLCAPAARARIAFVDPRDVAQVAALVLVEDGHDGHTYALTGPEAITFERVADELTIATGRQVRYVDQPDETARQAMVGVGLPPTAADAIIDIFRSQRAGSMAHTTTTVRALLGRDAGTFAAFAHDYADLFVDAKTA